MSERKFIPIQDTMTNILYERIEIRMASVFSKKLIAVLKDIVIVISLETTYLIVDERKIRG